jgi:endonuclease YncB( thermonuclease family)
MRASGLAGKGALAAAVLGLIALAHAAISGAAETLPGPVRARVLSVIDGDTLAVQARIWLGQDVDIHVRLTGIDAPELKGRCAEERRAAVEARETLVRLVGFGGGVGGEVILSDIRYDKYGGRVLARVAAPDGTDLAQALVARHLARPYDGRSRAGWCG